MKLYVLTKSIQWESSDVIGIFSTKEKAIQAFRDICDFGDIPPFDRAIFHVQYKNIYYDIEIHTLDNK